MGKRRRHRNKLDDGLDDGDLDVFVMPEIVEALGPQQAANLINQQTGAQTVNIVTNRAEADVIVRAGNPPGNLAGIHRPRGDRTDLITIDRRVLAAGTPQTFQSTLLAHELGHALGLEHRTGRNLMNPDIISSDLSRAQIRSILGQTSTPQSIPVSEVRRVRIEYDIAIPNSIGGTGASRMFLMQSSSTQWPDIQQLAEAVRQELIRGGYRNPDIFGGRA